MAEKNNILASLTAAALALPSMVSKVNAGTPISQPTTNFQYSHYTEGDERINVDIYQGNVVVPIEQNAEFSLDWVVDTFSGATPVLNLPVAIASSTTGASGIDTIDNSQIVLDNQEVIQVMTGASTFERRYGVDLGFSYFLDDLTLKFVTAYSKEPDYLSKAYKLGLAWDFNQKLTTLSLGFGQVFDQIRPSTRMIQENKISHQVKFGLSQILSKQSLINFSADYMYDTGYLSNPYKKVFIQTATPVQNLINAGMPNVFYDQRPEVRHQGAIAIAYVHYIAPLDAALHVDYRYFRDSWNIDSHTFEAVWHQPISENWMLIPRLRYYSQSSAQFYKTYFTQTRSEPYYSSDHRLSAFGVLSGGLKLTTETTNVNAWTNKIKFEVGLEYAQQASKLTLGKTSDSAITDFNYLLITTAIKIEF